MSEPYYQDAYVTLHCAQAEEILPNLSQIGCVVTSPPYNILATVPRKPTGMHRENGWVKDVNAIGYTDALDESAYISWQIRIGELVADSSGPGASFFYNHKIRYRGSQLLHPIDIVRRFPGWSLRQEIVWDRRKSMVFNARMFPPSDERIYWLVKEGAGHAWNQQSTQWLSVWQMSTPTDLGSHPCPFPLALPTRCIAATTTAEDYVLDPFAGSGTTLVAAKQLGRRAIGVEIEERYCEIAARRLAQGVLEVV